MLKLVSHSNTMRNNILFVEDDMDFIDEISEILIDYGFSVDTVFDGLKCKEILSKKKYDLILLDIKIPNIDGLSVLKWIRKNKIDTKVIMLTGKPLKENILQYTFHKTINEEKLLDQADSVLNKPVDILMLIKTIKDII